MRVRITNEMIDQLRSWDTTTSIWPIKAEKASVIDRQMFNPRNKKAK